MARKLTRRQVIAAGGGAAASAYALGGLGPTLAQLGREARERPSSLRYYYPVRRQRPRTIETDICVYGGTSAGIVAAIQASRLGRSVSLAAFGRHLGGLSASGLGATDTGRIDAIGGLSREFYRRVGAKYGAPENFRFEPHVAEEVFEEWVAEHEVDVHREQRLRSVRMDGDRIVEIQMESGYTFRAGMFIDAGYEGDLLEGADVSWFAGREGNDAYDETLNGVQFRSGHQFREQIDPYVTPGDPASGLLEGISAEPPGTTGDGDQSIQAFNFRLCLTRAADRLPFPKPREYDPARYELLLRYIEAGVWDAMNLNLPMPNGKTDLNNNGAVSTDNIGRNYDWPDGSYRERERIFQDHVTYQQGMLWFLANDERVPTSIRDHARSYGLPRDEFEDTGGWPHELYIREARRLVADYVMTEHNCRGTVVPEDSVGLASYTMDSHNCRRVLVDGHPRNEGDVQIGVPQPYPISYRAIVPQRGECANLLVPVCLSTSHIAFGSIRMEPVFMLLGHSAATAASLALDADGAVQDVDYPALRRSLLRDRMVLEWPPPTEAGLTVDAPDLGPGEEETVTTTLANDDIEPYLNVRFALDGPEGWSVVASTPTVIDEIAPGDSAEVSWTVTAPPQPEPAVAAGLRAEAIYEVAGSEITQEVQAPVYVIEPVGDPYRTFAATEAHFGQRAESLAIIAGGADIWEAVDEYGALYRPGAGGPDTVAVTKLVSQDPTHESARAGLVMRNDITKAGESAGYIILVAKPENGFLMLWDSDGDGYVNSVARAETGVTPYPAWLRLERTGTNFTGSYSVDGTTWIEVGQATVPSAAATQDVGLVCCSHVPQQLGRAVFDGLEIGPAG